jgi:hypothetical protein
MIYNAWRSSKKAVTAIRTSIWLEETSDFFDYRRAVQVSVTLFA